MRNLTYIIPIAVLLLLGGIHRASCLDAPIPPRVQAKDGAALVWVPAGEFLMGTTPEDVQAMLKLRPMWKEKFFLDEQPRHTVYLDGYWIYKREVTVGQYRKFCTETKRAMPALPKWAEDDFPMVNVSWDDASAYAQWAGARLPTEAQWEKAARGADGRRFPWGDVWDEQKCNNYSDKAEIGGGFQANRAAKVGSYPASDSPYGVQDLVGNVWEWCADYYAADYYANAPAKNPTGPAHGEYRVLRGGSWGSSSISLRAAGRHADSPDATYHDDGGFRCVVVGKK